MAQIAYVDWDGLKYYHGKVTNYVTEKLEDCLKDGGKYTFNDLLKVGASYNNNNFIYEITNDFTVPADMLDCDESLVNQSFKAGTKVKVSENANEYRFSLWQDANGTDPELAIKVAKVEADLDTLTDRVNALSGDADASGYYTKDEIDSNFYTRGDTDLRIQEAFSNIEIPDVDITFEEDYYVGNAIGGLTEGLSVKGMSVKDLLISMLELHQRFTITFVINGSSYTETYREGAAVILIDPPKQEGYVFTGWYLNDIKVDAHYTMPSENITLEARFEEVLEPKDSYTVEDIKKHDIPALVGSSKDGVSPSTFTYKEFTSAAEYDSLPTEDWKTNVGAAFYEYRKADNSIETGYQVYAGPTGKGNYYRVAIPKGLVISSIWKDGLSWTIYEQPEGTFNKVGEETHNEIAYEIYQDTSVGKGQCYRFVLVNS